MSDTQKKRDILDSQDKGISAAENPPAKLFRQILYDLQIHHYKWAHLLRIYLADPRNNAGRTGPELCSARGNLNKELRKPRITFSMLMTGIKLLNPVKVRFVAELTWPNGKVTTHGTDVVLRRGGTQDANALQSAMGDDNDDIISY